MEDNVFPTDFIEKYSARRAAFEEMAKGGSLRKSGVPARKGGSGSSSASEPDEDEEAPDEEDEAEGEE